MKKSRFTEPQLFKMLSEQEQGKSVSDICRVHGIKANQLSTIGRIHTQE